MFVRSIGVVFAGRYPFPRPRPFRRCRYPLNPFGPSPGYPFVESKSLGWCFVRCVGWFVIVLVVIVSVVVVFDVRFVLGVFGVVVVYRFCVRPGSVVSSVGPSAHCSCAWYA